MSASRTTNSDLLDYLAGVQFKHISSSYLSGFEPHEVDTLHWTVTAVIAASSGDLDGEAWMHRPGVSLSPPAKNVDDETTVDIFEMSGFTVDLSRTPSLFDVLDSDTSDSAHFLAAVDDDQPLHLAAELDEQLESFGSGFVVFDRALLAPAWRGLGGVGRLLTGHGLRWVAADARCIVGQPFPFEAAERVGPDRENDNDPQLVAGLTQVRHVWSSLGFFPFREDLFVFDPSNSTMDNAVADLEAKLVR